MGLDLPPSVEQRGNETCLIFVLFQQVRSKTFSLDVDSGEVFYFSLLGPDYCCLSSMWDEHFTLGGEQIYASVFSVL